MVSEAGSFGRVCSATSLWPTDTVPQSMLTRGTALALVLTACTHTPRSACNTGSAHTVAGAEGGVQQVHAMRARCARTSQIGKVFGARSKLRGVKPRKPTRPELLQPAVLRLLSPRVLALLLTLDLRHFATSPRRDQASLRALHCADGSPPGIALRRLRRSCGRGLGRCVSLAASKGFKGVAACCRAS